MDKLWGNNHWLFRVGKVWGKWTLKNVRQRNKTARNLVGETGGSLKSCESLKYSSSSPFLKWVQNKKEGNTYVYSFDISLSMILFSNIPSKSIVKGHQGLKADKFEMKTYRFSADSCLWHRWACPGTVRSPFPAHSSSRPSGPHTPAYHQFAYDQKDSVHVTFTFTDLNHTGQRHGELFVQRRQSDLSDLCDPSPQRVAHPAGAVPAAAPPGPRGRPRPCAAGRPADILTWLAGHLLIGMNPPMPPIIMEPGRDMASPYLNSTIRGHFRCCEMKPFHPPDTLGVLHHLAKHLIVHIDLAVWEIIVSEGMSQLNPPIYSLSYWRKQFFSGLPFRT